MEEQSYFSNLIEDSWFFRNSLLNTSKTMQKITRCNSDPCPSSTKDTSVSPLDPLKPNTLLRTPSLPLSLGAHNKCQINHNEDEDEDEDEYEEPRMGDLIIQAMPMTPRRLDRSPSLPPCRGKQVSNVASNVENDAVVGRLSRIESSDSLVLLQEKGPVAMTKLTRRVSIDPSMLLPKHASKGAKQTMSNSKSRPHLKMEPPNTTNNTAKTGTKPRKLDRTKSQKSFNDLEVEELQGCKDLGFSFDSKDLSPSVTQLLPALQRTASLNTIEIGKVRRPYLSESWQKPSSPLSAPPVPKGGDPKDLSSADMKAQIKFWARAVASNVHQEC